MKTGLRHAKHLLKPPGMDPRHGLKKTYKNLLCGLKKILKGEIRFDHRYGKTEYHPLFPAEGNVPQNFKHTFAIASVIRNEGRYIQEWIEFHRLVGCTKFFIYDNSSTDDTRKILNFYAKKGVVEWIEWPHITPWLNTQQTAFCHAIYKSRGQVKWLAMIDADEYLFSPYPQDFIAFLDKYSDLPALIVYWDMFGTSGHKSRPDGLVTENYTRRLDVDHPMNQYHPLSKSIVQPHEVTAVSNSHCFQTRIWPVMGYDEDRNPITRVSDIHRQKGIRLHHYYTKSLEDWNDRKSRTGDSTGYLVNNPKAIKLRRYEDAFKDIHRFEVEDKSCHFLLPALKKKLGKNSTP
jgi:glycosyltransferase involved in cell wall biosynthesis